MGFSGLRQEVRGSALWGSGKRGTGSRGNALWGSGKRRTALLADARSHPRGAASGRLPVSNPRPSKPGFVAPSLLSSASAHPADTFAVIVQGKGGNQAAKAVADVLGVSTRRPTRTSLDRRRRRRADRRADPGAGRGQARHGDHPDARVRLSGRRHDEVAVRHRRAEVLGDRRGFGGSCSDDRDRGLGHRRVARPSSAAASSPTST